MSWPEAVVAVVTLLCLLGVVLALATDFWDKAWDGLFKIFGSKK